MGRKDGIALINSISKQRIPSKYSYVLKTGQLENLLTDNNINIHIELNYIFSSEMGSVFEAFYWLPNNNVPYDRVYIRARALPKENLTFMREKLDKVILPEFIVWINNIMALPDNSTLLKHNLHFHAVFHANEIFIYS